MKILNPIKRLDMFLGKVDKRHTEIISKFIYGHNILDLGCGFGSTTAQLTLSGSNIVGIDNNIDVINAAKKKFPYANILLGNAEKLDFENDCFDTVILKDSLHHLYNEANFEIVKSEILRVVKPKSRIIFFDPNITFMIRTMRRIISHRDEECRIETAKEIMNQLGYKIIHSDFNTLFCFPLSGAYIGINFVPNIALFQSFMLYAEMVIEKSIKKINAGNFLFMRYMIVGERA